MFQSSPGGGSQTSLISTDAMMKLDDELSSVVRSHSQHSLSSPAPDGTDHAEPRVQLTELQHKSLTGRLLPLTAVLVFLLSDESTEQL